MSGDRWIFLDDERMPAAKKPLPWLADEPVIVRSYDEFVAEIEANGCPAFITFDHDLGPGKNGFDCAKWFVEWILDDESRYDPEFQWYAHTQNPVGLANIAGLIQPFRRMMEAKRNG